jgi:hypothetical protein
MFTKDQETFRDRIREQSVCDQSLQTIKRKKRSPISDLDRKREKGYLDTLFCLDERAVLAERGDPDHLFRSLLFTTPALSI